MRRAFASFNWLCICDCCAGLVHVTALLAGAVCQEWCSSSGCVRTRIALQTRARASVQHSLSYLLAAALLPPAHTHAGVKR